MGRVGGGGGSGGMEGGGGSGGVGGGAEVEAKDKVLLWREYKGMSEGGRRRS